MQFTEKQIALAKTKFAQARFHGQPARFAIAAAAGAVSLTATRLRLAQELQSSAGSQAARFCHSAKAAERRDL